MGDYKTFHSWNKTVDSAKADVDNLIQEFKLTNPMYDAVGDYSTWYNSEKGVWWVCLVLRKESLINGEENYE